MNACCRQLRLLVVVVLVIAVPAGAKTPEPRGNLYGDYGGLLYEGFGNNATIHLSTTADGKALRGAFVTYRSKCRGRVRTDADAVPGTPFRGRRVAWHLTFRGQDGSVIHRRFALRLSRDRTTFTAVYRNTFVGVCDSRPVRLKGTLLAPALWRGKTSQGLSVSFVLRPFTRDPESFEWSARLADFTAEADLACADGSRLRQAFRRTLTLDVVMLNDRDPRERMRVSESGPDFAVHGIVPATSPPGTALTGTLELEGTKTPPAPAPVVDPNDPDAAPEPPTPEPISCASPKLRFTARPYAPLSE